MGTFKHTAIESAHFDVLWRNPEDLGAGQAQTALHPGFRLTLSNHFFVMIGRQMRG
jgi:hypothetical protein